MGIPCRAATVRGVRCEARPGLTSRASCPAVTSIPSQMCWVNQPAVPMWGTSSAHAHRLPGGRLRLAQPRRIVRRRPARRPGRLHGRRSGPVERRRAGRRGDRSSMAGQAQLVSGRHRGPDDPATGAAGPILGLSTQAASDCSPRQISKPDKDALNSASPGVRTHTDPHFGRGATGNGSDQDVAHSGGLARGYQDLPAPLAVSATAERTAARPVCLCIASARRDRPHMPPSYRRSRRLGGRFHRCHTWLHEQVRRRYPARGSSRRPSSVLPAR
jgi:hypothetical protein